MAQLPLRYTLRNLKRRKTRTILTLMGISLVVGAVVFMLSFSRSLSASFRKTGDPDNIIIISKKAQTFILSSISAQNADQITAKLADEVKTYTPEGAQTPKSLVSSEVYIGLNIEVEGGETFRAGHQRALLHGLDPEMALHVNSSVELTDGRLPRRGRRELMVGSTAFTRIGIPDEDLMVGAKIWLLNKKWTVVGRFTAPGTVMDYEIWAHVYDLNVYLRRQDYSFMRAKLDIPPGDTEALKALCNRISTDEQFEVKAFPEQVYFAEYAEGFDFFKRFAYIMAAIIIIGGIVAGMNTMYTAVLGRIREIGTLQVIGFSKKSVLVAILTESLILAIAGGIMGCCIGYAANGIPIKIPMAAFKVTVDFGAVAWAMGAALLIGLGGAYVPAYRALKLRMVDAVRSQ